MLFFYRYTLITRPYSIPILPPLCCFWHFLFFFTAIFTFYFVSSHITLWGKQCPDKVVLWLSLKRPKGMFTVCYTPFFFIVICLFINYSFNHCLIRHTDFLSFIFDESNDFVIEIYSNRNGFLFLH